MIKKIIFIIYIFTLFFYPNIVANANDEYTECEITTLTNPDIKECPFGKIESNQMYCGISVPYTLADNEICCCRAKRNYSCQWKSLITNTSQTGFVNITGGCEKNEIKGNDCDPNQEHENKDYLKTKIEYYCCCPAKAEEYKEAEFTIPQFQIKINNIELTQAYCPKDDSRKCEIPWIAQYIEGIYKYVLSIGGILAAIVLMAGGILWLISAGDASKITQAKNLILSSLTGLIILLSSYLILQQINPNLTILRPISVKMIERIVYDPIENGSDSENNISDNCANEGELESIKDIVTTNARSPYLNKTGKEGLIKAIEEAKKEGVELLVTSAFRTYEHQKKLWDEALAKHGDEATAAKYVAKPGSCGGHRSGQAIDVCIKGTFSCTKIGNSSDADYSDEDVIKLQNIMKRAGWTRYCGEWWHFQYKEPVKNPC